MGNIRRRGNSSGRGIMAIDLEGLALGLETSLGNSSHLSGKCMEVLKVESFSAFFGRLMEDGLGFQG